MLSNQLLVTDTVGSWWGGAERPTWSLLPLCRLMALPCAFLLFGLVVHLGPQVARKGTLTLWEGGLLGHV